MKNLNPWILNLGIIYHSLILLFCFFSQSNVFCIPFFPRALCVCTHWHSQLNAFLIQAASVIIKQSHTFDWTYCVETHQTVLKRSPSFDRWTVLPSVLTLSLPVFSTLAATLNTSLMHCQMHIQKGQLFFKSACQVHPSPERGFENGWRERERERREEPERQRREEQETRRHHQPIYLTAIYHSESMCQQLCACFMVDCLPPPPPPPCPKLYRRTLCLYRASGTHQNPQGSWRDRSASASEAELWLYWLTVLPPRQLTTAWSAAGSRGGGRNAASAKVFLRTVPAALSACQAVCLSVWVSGDESDFRTVLPSAGDCVGSVWLSSQKVRWIPEGSFFESDRSVSEPLVLSM